MVESYAHARACDHDDQPDCGRRAGPPDSQASMPEDDPVEHLLGRPEGIVGVEKMREIGTFHHDLSRHSVVNFAHI